MVAEAGNLLRCHSTQRVSLVPVFGTGGTSAKPPFGNHPFANPELRRLWADVFQASAPELLRSLFHIRPRASWCWGHGLQRPSPWGEGTCPWRHPPIPIHLGCRMQGGSHTLCPQQIVHQGNSQSHQPRPIKGDTGDSLRETLLEKLSDFAGLFSCWQSCSELLPQVHSLKKITSAYPKRKGKVKTLLQTEWNVNSVHHLAHQLLTKFLVK